MHLYGLLLLAQQSAAPLESGSVFAEEFLTVELSPEEGRLVAEAWISGIAAPNPETGPLLADAWIEGVAHINPVAADHWVEAFLEGVDEIRQRDGDLVAEAWLSVEENPILAHARAEAFLTGLDELTSASPTGRLQDRATRRIFWTD